MTAVLALPAVLLLRLLGWRGQRQEQTRYTTTRVHSEWPESARPEVSRGRR
ncbi:hypothetical protein ACFP81_07835 [Deinococcus lacus]|uniref:Uncharacterized protein n=1 Tax=Deinococcus lacus TaxID=392561 RepID=A0ABW1YCF2_9DEIO